MSGGAGREYRIGFVLEQTLGHITHAKNLQVNVPRDPSVRPFWHLIPFQVRRPATKIPLYNRNWTVRAGWRARRALAATRRTTAFDALFFHTHVPAILSTDWLRRVPSVISMDATPIQYDGFGEYYNHPPGSALAQSIKRRVHRECFASARQIVTWAEWTKKGLVADYEIAPEQVTVMPPGVNTREWKRPTPCTRDTESVKILFVGADFERKGGAVLLEVFRALRRPGLELHIVTRNPPPDEAGVYVYKDLEANSDALKNLYFDSDIFCLPTFADCMPMVLSEAGAAGLSLVSTDIAGIPEIVREGETGFTVPRGDVGALKVALERLVENSELRLGMGEAAARVVAREFDAERNTTRLLDVIKQVADQAQSQN